MNKMIKVVVIPFCVVIIPVLGKLEMLHYPQIWLVFIIGVLASFFQPNYNVVKDKNKNVDNGTERLIIFSVFITQLLIVIEATYLRFPNSINWDTITTISLVLILLGLALRSWAIQILGKFFTMHISIQENHKVVSSGPYKYFRHPSYVGAFFIYIGIAIFLHSWYSLIISLILLPIAWVKRIYYEEKLLIDELGDDYKEYSKEVKRVIPKIW